MQAAHASSNKGGGGVSIVNLAVTAGAKLNEAQDLLRDAYERGLGIRLSAACLVPSASQVQIRSGNVWCLHLRPCIRIPLPCPPPLRDTPAQ